MSDITDEMKREMQRRAQIPHLPTDLTYECRQAVSGEGPRAYDWSDKPHRLVYDLCRHIEAQAALTHAVPDAQPVAWRRMNEQRTQSTGVTDTTYYRDVWLREGSIVEPLYAAAPAPVQPVAWQLLDKHGRWITMPGDWTLEENVKGYEYRPLYAAAPPATDLKAEVERLQHILKQRGRMAETSRKFWVRAAKKAMDGDFSELRNRVDLAEAEPMEIVQSAADQSEEVRKIIEGWEGE